MSFRHPQRRLGACAWLALALCLALGLTRPSWSEDAIGAASADPEWLALGHYQADRRAVGGYRSDIHKGEFFLSDAGSEDPVAELRGTVEAMRAAAAALHPAPDMDPRCRFPARFLWLQRVHPQLVKGVGQTACPSYDRWTRNQRVESLSIVFATGYLNNPASFYGHTLLKLNFPGESPSARLMDESLNYGAIIEGASDPLSYMIKGVTGGYDGGFSQINYYFHEHNYGETELRDLWEYRLALSGESVDLVVAHAWEVLGKRYTYYFFRRNCAFRMAEMVQIIQGVQVLPKHRPWTIPQSLIRQISEARYEGRPLVSEVLYHPSRQSRLYEKFKVLDGDERAIVRKTVENDAVLESEDFGRRSLSSRHAILDTLLDYHSYARDAAERKSGDQSPEYMSVLRKRYELPPGPELAASGSRPEAPHEARPPGWFQLGWLGKSEGGNAVFVRVRPAYYDVLDSSGGHVANASLSMLDLQLEGRDEDIRVRRLDVVAIESVNPGLTSLPGDSGMAWKLRIGAEQARSRCSDCLVARLQADIGVAQSWLGSRLSTAAYAGAAVQSNSANQGPGFARASVTATFRPTEGFGIVASYEYRAPVDSVTGPYGVWLAEARLRLGGAHDIRIRYLNEESRELGIGIGAYW